MMSSMIVAKVGEGDMAVSNALGSNVFDINFGVGVPLLLSFIAFRKAFTTILSKSDRVSTFLISKKILSYNRIKK